MIENYTDYSDLALERRRADVSVKGVSYVKERGDLGEWERIKIDSIEGEKSIGRPRGAYDTLRIPDMNTLDDNEIDEAKNEIAKELCRMCEYLTVSPMRILVVGLGNEELTPDALGPLTARLVRPTLHIKRGDIELFETLECSEIAVICPDVKAHSGLESAEVVRGVCDSVFPDLVIAIDSLASVSPTRLGNTVQISSTGITPGTGLGKRQGSINEDTLGVPVIAVGVPTIIDSRCFATASDCSSLGEGMFVSPKDINEIVRVAARIISGGINQAFGIYTF